MSEFTSPADLRIFDAYRFVLISEFEYHVGQYPSEEVICVPTGFVTDLASVPRILWSILPPLGEYSKAAIIHDYMYHKKSYSRKRADEIFREAMAVLGVAKWRRTVMYLAVRMFGGNSWRSR